MTAESNPSDYTLSPKEVALNFGVSYQTVIYHIKQGNLSHLVHNCRYRLKYEDVKVFFADTFSNSDEPKQGRPRFSNRTDTLL